MKFFVMRRQPTDGDSETDYVPVDGSTLGDAPRCPSCGRFVGMLPLFPPVRIELDARGSHWGDVAFGPGEQILISERLKTLVDRHALTGFNHVVPVEVSVVRRHQQRVGFPPKYYLASISRSRAAVDEGASGIVRDEPWNCVDCRLGGIIKRIERVVLEPGTWSNEDVFYIRGIPGTIMVSERFKRLCSEYNVLNCALVPAEEHRVDHYPQER